MTEKQLILNTDAEAYEDSQNEQTEFLDEVIVERKVRKAKNETEVILTEGGEDSPIYLQE